MTQVSKRNNWSKSLSLQVSVWPHGTPLFSPGAQEAETGGLSLKPPGLQSKVLSQTARMALENTVYRRGNQQRMDVLVLEGGDTSTGVMSEAYRQAAQCSSSDLSSHRVSVGPTRPGICYIAKMAIFFLCLHTGWDSRFA